ncbi:MAG: sugar ABC transporter permease [Actinobacteria bacterium]|nr:sugar ABC transporter permease [Actinomycetota bacterium]
MGKKGKIFIGRRGRNRLILPFLSIAVLWYLVFMVYPAIRAFYISLFDWSGISRTRVFIGLANFKEALTSELFWTALKHNIFVVLVGGLITISLALFFAVILSNRKLKGKRFFDTVFFAPVVMSGVAVGLLWNFIYNPSTGLLNNILRAIGLGSLAKPWLGLDNIALFAVLIAYIWARLAFFIVILRAGIEKIPPTYSEAARIDGANEFQVFFKVTLPLLWEVFRIVIVLWIIQSFMFFDVIYVMTGGGPGGKTEVIATLLYKQAFESYFIAVLRYGYATAIAVILFLLILVVSLSGFKLLRKEPVEY